MPICQFRKYPTGRDSPPSSSFRAPFAPASGFHPACGGNALESSAQCIRGGTDAAHPDGACFPKAGRSVSGSSPQKDEGFSKFLIHLRKSLPQSASGALFSGVAAADSTINPPEDAALLFRAPGPLDGTVKRSALEQYRPLFRRETITTSEFSGAGTRRQLRRRPWLRPLRGPELPDAPFRRCRRRAAPFPPG